MRKLFTLTLVGAAMTASTALGATIVTYTDAASFNASTIVGGSTTVTEDFNTNDSLFTTFSPLGAPGVIPGFYFGHRTTRVTNTYSELVTLDAGNMTAFGGTWDLAPFSGLGGGVKITIALVGGGTQVLTPILGWNVGNGTTPFFFGFTSDAAFTSVTLSTGGQGGVTTEGFNLDDLLVEQAAGAVQQDDPGPGPGSVPEPSSFGLMGIAMVGLGLVRKFRR